MINTIDSVDLRRFDLNLLPVLITLLDERSVTRTAERLHLGQPAVSAALARLRDQLGDPLLVRGRSGMEPTPRAIEIGTELRPLLVQVNELIRGRIGFDPATSAHTFRIGMPDNHEHFVMPRLLARLQKEAPAARVLIRAATGKLASQLLDAGEVDLACGRIDEVPAWQRRQPITHVGYLSLWDPKQVSIGRALTMEHFVRVPHLLTSPRGEFDGVVDRALASLGKTRRVILATQNFSTLPAVLRSVPAIATMPEHSARLFAKDYGLRVSPPPVELPPFETALVWLARNDVEPAYAWFREQVMQVVRSIGAKHGASSRRI